MGSSWVGGRMKHWCQREPTSVIICCINRHSCCVLAFYRCLFLSIFSQPPERTQTEIIINLCFIRDLRGLLLKDNQTFTHVSNSKRRFHRQTA
ncbi:hypothetical protein Peur_000545 [Populus x canadensis]